MTDLRKLEAVEGLWVQRRLLVIMAERDVLHGDGWLCDYQGAINDITERINSLLREKLEGGGQADRNQDDATATLRDPAAPDQPHEFVPKLLSMTPVGRRATCDRTDCCRPADDPIHQTNEVSNGRQGQGKLLRDRDCDRSDHHQRDHDHRAEQVSDENEQKRSDLADQTDSDGGRREHRSDVRAGDGVGHAGEVSGVADDRPMVTNYDAEAEAQARIAELKRELGGYKKAYAGLADDYQRTLRERDKAWAELNWWRLFYSFAEGKPKEASDGKG